MTEADRRAQTGGRLMTLEAGRFLAALTVMLGHYSAIVEKERGGLVFGNAFGILHLGVPFFFVLSGFVMYHVHRRDIGVPARVPNFVRKRAVRLLPMFWAVSLPMLAGYLLVPALADERPLSPTGIVADLLLLPHADAILAISWTLRHEVVFYALFALVLWRGGTMMWLIVAWAAVSLIGVPWGHAPALGSESLLASSLNLGFPLGIAAAMATERRPPRHPGRWAGAAGAMVLAMLVLEFLFTRRSDHAQIGFGLAGSVAYLILSAMLIYGLVNLERHWRMPQAGLWRLLGGASYLLYLVHQPIASVAIRIARPLRQVPPEIMFLALAAAALAAAIIAHVVVERPLLARLSRRR